jgi:hypothetical protein
MVADQLTGGGLKKGEGTPEAVDRGDPEAAGMKQTAYEPI